MHPGFQSEGQWFCKPCDLVLDSFEALLDHKKQMRADGHPRHVHCKHCGMDFKTQRAELFHIQTFHAKEQELVCASCGKGPFTRLAGLISHIDRGQCPVLDTSDIDQRREENSQFSRKLQQLTNEPIKNSFTRYMSPRPTPRDGRVSWTDVKQELPSSKTDLESQPSASLTASGGVSAEQSVRKRPISIFDSEIFDSRDPNHPDHPSFNAATHFCSWTGAYVCPKLPCGKIFKGAQGLVGHLRSTVHGNRTYQCPCCLDKFKSLAAIVAHAEQSSVHCHVRETSDYDAFIHQLTGGIVDVDEERHEDGTIKYNTTEKTEKNTGTTGDMLNVLW